MTLQDLRDKQINSEIYPFDPVCMFNNYWFYMDKHLKNMVGPFQTEREARQNLEEHLEND